MTSIIGSLLNIRLFIKEGNFTSFPVEIVASPIYRLPLDHRIVLHYRQRCRATCTHRERLSTCHKGAISGREAESLHVLGEIDYTHTTRMSNPPFPPKADRPNPDPRYLSQVVMSAKEVIHLIIHNKKTKTTFILDLPLAPPAYVQGIVTHCPRSTTKPSSAYNIEIIRVS